METIFAQVRLNARVQPIDRGDMYEDPLQEALEEHGWGEVTGGGTGINEDGEIEFCCIDLDLHDVEKGVPFVCEVLESIGAPKGSMLTYKVNGETKEVPFGQMEGLGIYFNGSDLPDEVYENCDINYVYDEIGRLIDDIGTIQGHWAGPTETALYLYGNSVNAMKEAVAELMADYPLCQKARLEVIA